MERVTVYTSWRGLLAATLSPLILLALGIRGLMVAGPRPLPLVITVAGALLAVVVVFDYPRHSRISLDGIDRICLLRRQRFAWSDVVAIERAPVRHGLARSRSGGAADRYVNPMRGAIGFGTDPAQARAGADNRRVAGGLVLRAAGRKRYLLTDRIETQAEFDRIAEVVRASGAAASIRAARPSRATPPARLRRKGD